MKNKIFIVSLSIFALMLVVSGCSLYGENKNMEPSVEVDTEIDTDVPDVTVIPTESIETTEPTETSLVMKASVDISNFAFNPAVLTIKKGTTVTWTNNEQVPHDIKSESFNSDILKNGQKYSMTFGDAGIFNYLCSLHPSMTGQLIVE